MVSSIKSEGTNERMVVYLTVILHQVLVVLGWFVAISLCFIVVYTESLQFCDTASVCGEWSNAGLVAFKTLERPMFGVTVCWIIFACVTGNGGQWPAKLLMIFNSV